MSEATNGMLSIHGRLTFSADGTTVTGLNFSRQQSQIAMSYLREYGIDSPTPDQIGRLLERLIPATDGHLIDVHPNKDESTAVKHGPTVDERLSYLYEDEGASQISVADNMDYLYEDEGASQTSVAGNMDYQYEDEGASQTSVAGNMDYQYEDEGASQTSEAGNMDYRYEDEGASQTSVAGNMDYLDEDEGASQTSVYAGNMDHYFDTMSSVGSAEDAQVARSIKVAISARAPRMLNNNTPLRTSSRFPACISNPLPPILFVDPFDLGLHCEPSIPVSGNHSQPRRNSLPSSTNNPSTLNYPSDAEDESSVLEESDQEEEEEAQRVSARVDHEGRRLMSMVRDFNQRYPWVIDRLWREEQRSPTPLPLPTTITAAAPPPPPPQQTNVGSRPTAADWAALLGVRCSLSLVRYLQE